MKRREFFKALGALFGASVGATITQATAFHIEGNPDVELIAKIRTEMAASNKEMMRQLQRSIGPMANRWDDRYGA